MSNATPSLPSPGRVVWITGLSGAGKSTLAEALVSALRGAGKPVVMLDGDALREVFGAVDAQHHGREARLGLALRYAQLCKTLADQGMTIVIATISLFREVHAWNRQHLPGYVEVLLDVPLAELRRRDPKGIYRRFDAGELQDVAGLDLAVDLPTAPHVHLLHDPARPVSALVDAVIQHLHTRTSP
jgi:adenylylsulfate kinase-like enzyme